MKNNTLTILPVLLLGAFIFSISALPIDSSTALKISDPAATAPATAPVVKKIRLFAPAQYDSVLALVPSGDSIKQAGRIVGIGVDETSNDIVIVSFDAQGNPVKTVVPAADISKKPVAANVAQPGQAGKPTRHEQNGRTWFIIESTVKSAFTYGTAYSTIFSDSSGRGQVITGATLLTIGGVLYGSYAFTKNMELGYGKVALMNYGSTMLGSYYPVLLGNFLHNATSIDKYSPKPIYGPADPYSGYRTIIYQPPLLTDYIRSWSSIVTFPLGIYLGSRLNIVGNDDYGKVAYMEYFSQTFGALSFALPVFYFSHPVDQDSLDYSAAANGLALALLPAGFYAGYKLVENKDISAGRGTLLWVTGGMGSLTGLGLSLLGDNYYGIASARTILASTIAGYAGGTLLGIVYRPQTDYTFWQSIFIGASSACGAGVMEAFPLLANANNHRAYILAAIAGGWGGFYLGDRLSVSLFEHSSRDRQSTNLKVSLPGLAMVPALLGSGKSGSIDRRSFMRNMPALPVADLEWRF